MEASPPTEKAAGSIDRRRAVFQASRLANILEDVMRRTITALVATSIAAAGIAAPKPAEARCIGCWVGAGIAAAVIGGAIASSSYGYGYGYPASSYGYGYPAYGYGYGYPAYSPGYGYPAYSYAYRPAYYGYAYAPRRYYGRRYYRY
jgi:hypothetical protein